MTFQKITPLHRTEILSLCAVLQDASPAQFERACSGDKDEGEPTVLKWPLESVLVGQNHFIATLSAVFVSKLRKYVQKSQKKWINKSYMQSRNVHDFLTEIVLYKQKQPDDISVRRIKILFSPQSENFPLLRSRGNFCLE